MDIKVYTIRLNPPRWLRNAVVYVGLPVGAILGSAAAVRAGVTLTQFTAGNPIKAADVNNNFTALSDAITGLQGQMSTPPQTSVGTGSQTGTLASDLIYTLASVTLSPGTWLIQAEATVTTADTPDGVQLGLYDATSGVDVTDSRGGIGESQPYASAETHVPLHTSKVLVVAAPTKIEMKAFRNGNSTLRFGYPGVLSGANRLWALQLR